MAVMSPALADATVSPPEAAPAPAGTPAPAFPSPFLDVLEGKVPGVTVPPLQPGQENEVQNYAVEHFTDLAEVLEYTELPDMRSVFYNPQLVNEKDIQAAAEQGTLDSIAPLAVELGAPPSAPQAAPAAQGVPQEGPAPAAAPQTAGPGPLAGMSVAPAGGPPANRTLERARLRNAAPPPANTPGGPIPVLQRRPM